MPRQVKSVERKIKCGERKGEKLYGLFIQTNDNIYFFNLQGLVTSAKNEHVKDICKFSIVSTSPRSDSSVKLGMKRGIIDQFYFARKDKGASSDSLIKVKVDISKD